MKEKRIGTALTLDDQVESGLDHFTSLGKVPSTYPEGKLFTFRSGGSTYVGIKIDSRVFRVEMEVV